MLRADLHIHTCYSMDCDSPLDKIMERCLKLKFNCLAITDHGTIAGALALGKIAPFRVIIGEEILTPYGEIMGLFLTDEIPSPFPMEDTLSMIKEQGGLICVPHPFDKGRGSSSLQERVLESIITRVDIIEVFNSRSLPRSSCIRARQFARKYGIAASAGSDAHTIAEIGSTYLEMPNFGNKTEFKESLTKATICERSSRATVHVASSWVKFKKEHLSK